MNAPTSRKGYTFSPLSYAIIGACQEVQRQLEVHCMGAKGLKIFENGVDFRG